MALSGRKPARRPICAVVTPATLRAVRSSLGCRDNHARPKKPRIDGICSGPQNDDRGGSCEREDQGNGIRETHRDKGPHLQYGAEQRSQGRSDSNGEHTGQRRKEDRRPRFRGELCQDGCWRMARRLDK